MNCKPNCLAVRVKRSCPGHVPVGAIVETLRLCAQARIAMGTRGVSVPIENSWDVRYRGKVTGPLGLFLGVPDDDLRMIGNPGEDATDEMVALLGKPSSLPQPSKEHA